MSACAVMVDLERYLGTVDAEQFRSEQVSMRAEVIRTEMAKSLGAEEPGDLIADAISSGQASHADLLAAFRAGPEAFHALAARLIEVELDTRADNLAEKAQQAYEAEVERGDYA